MHPALVQFQAELPAIFQIQPPLGLSPTLYRNWCLGRSIHYYQQAVDDPQGFIQEVNHTLLEGTPVQGQATLLLRLYSWYPTEASLHPRLRWGHYQLLLVIFDQEVRHFYQRCAIAGHWTVEQLRRQVRTHWHLRRNALKQYHPELATPLPHWLPDPLVLELPPNLEYADEAALENAIVDQLAVFLLELGQELSFVARQLRLTTFSGLQMIIDLVFYQHRAQHYVLFELKNTPLSAAAVGQLQTYLQVFDDCWKTPQDAPSIGVLLCTHIDPALKRYSALHQNKQLFAVSFVHPSTAEAMPPWF